MEECLVHRVRLDRYLHLLVCSEALPFAGRSWSTSGGGDLAFGLLNAATSENRRGPLSDECFYRFLHLWEYIEHCVRALGKVCLPGP
ncbi:hypothetical protein GCM10012278_90810 [Nonomuraea glycinis]|uniref:Uncharacterized protein n=1 Tax=Nonomuraea glycinis TaxID=2047744 RepID=A0A918AFG7_9ACTN|nr:hypothetical protein GCM10012278_90810 [Nonomuraea glycinis]